MQKSNLGWVHLFKSSNFIYEFFLAFLDEAAVARDVGEVAVTGSIVNFRNREVVSLFVKVNHSLIPNRRYDDVLGDICKVSMGFAIILY